MNAEELVSIGRIGSSVGLRGEVRVNLYSADSDNLKEGKVLLLVHGAKTISAVCRGVRRQNGRPVIMLEGISDRTAADGLRDMEIFIKPEDLEELPEGQHYVRDIIGFDVYDEASGRMIGKLRDVIQNTAQSVLDIEGSDGKQILVPAVPAFMRGIDDEKMLIRLELIPGFLE